MGFYERAVFPLLALLDAEQAHRLILQGTSTLLRWGLLPPRHCPSAPITLLGITLRNPVGLAAGMDKNGEFLRVWEWLGLGFVEVGTVTPRPQPGNRRPRLWRLPRQKALFNRMGFNNAGIDAVIENIRTQENTLPLGLNIGKNTDTPLQEAWKDYAHCAEKVEKAGVGSFLVVNVSSPNTPALRTLQTEAHLEKILSAVKEKCTLPLLVKLAPEDAPHLVKTVETLAGKKLLEGLVLTNTLKGTFRGQEGGISGAPLFAHALQAVRTFRQALGNKMTIIGTGGIMSGKEAEQMWRAGATAIELFTGLVYRGPGLVRECVKSYIHHQKTENERSTP